VPITWDARFDFVILGSGAGSVPASLVVQGRAKSALIIEKAATIGGSTAISGGVLWIPNNPVELRAGVRDSYELSKTYLDACAGPYAPGSTAARRHAFLTEGPKMVEFLERAGMRFIHARGWPDYHENELPGGIARGRSVLAEVFDMHELGENAKLLRRLPRPPVRGTEGAVIGVYGRSWASKMAMLRVGWRLLQNRLGRDLVGMGGALQGRLFQIAFREKIPIWPSTKAIELILEDGRVCGVKALREGQECFVEARDGVLIDCGGFAQNPAMRQKYQTAPIGSDWTNAIADDTGDMIEHLKSIGADTYLMDQSWWVPISLLPNGARAINVADLSKPHCILVDASGSRYVNESTSYVALGMAMFKRNADVPAIPSWAILDSRHRNRYMWSGMKPGVIPPEWISSGYMKTAANLEDLAAQCKIEPVGLRKTVDRFNAAAKSGVDDDFRRGIGAFHRFYGDPTQQPSANLGSIEQPPFYAVAIYPGDAGTCGGIVTDEFARVLRPDGSVIRGAYATGNSTATVMGRSYPGAGASISPAAVFGYIAALHATRSG
jgi:3-oxosteroid 1-dehydrogenase